LLREFNSLDWPGDPEQCAVLVRKSRAGTLSESEHNELVEISDAREEANVRRIRLLCEIAALRGEPLGKVEAELGVPAHWVVEVREDE
jgi:hypothetical protein